MNSPHHSIHPDRGLLKAAGVVLVCMVVLAWVLLVTSCGPKAPDKSLILWEQPAPEIAATLHAKEISGRALYVQPTGSMEPFLTGGDWIVVDTAFPFAKIKAGDLLVYQASWLPWWSPVVCHMAAARSGDGWIMDGIANSHYENGSQTMMPGDFRGKVVTVYTKRRKA